MRYLTTTVILVTSLVILPARASGQQTSNGGSAGQPDSMTVQRLRAEIEKRGLTPDQVRARLRAAGYPDSLLDQYLSTGAPKTDILPRDSLLDVVRSLGLVDSVFIQSLARRDSARLSGRTSESSDTLKVFGLDVFRRASSQFEPSLSGAVGPNYRIGPGDVLALIISGEIERAFSLEVSREGFIVIPQVGQVYVANLTLAQVDALIFARLRQSYASISRSPNAATRYYLTVSRIHANQVFVIGEVRDPGSYQISSIGTVLTALYAAGGPSQNGTLRRVQVRRSGQLIATIDLYDYLIRGDASSDIRLETGDVVFVGVHGGYATVQGRVVRPAIYELVLSETLADLIEAAGGFSTEASLQRVQIRRILPSAEREAGGRDRVVLDVNPSQYALNKAPPFLLQPGDRVEVFGITSRERNSIVVSGAVWNPGVQGFKPGMRLSDALHAAGGLQPDVFLDQILVSRVESDRSRRSLHASLVDSLGVLREDLPLREDDSIRVYSRSEFVPDRYVAIAGAVKNGGQFRYRDGMTLRELLLLAGGPKEGADLREAEIARFPSARTQGVLAQTFRVPLDSSYLLERKSDGSVNAPPGVQLRAPSATEVTLRPYDNVLILRQPGWRMPGSVFVGGEVRYPGEYTIRTSSERLSDVLERAGGLTPEADPEGLIFRRAADSAGRIGVNLPSVLSNRRSRDNFIVAPGDSLIVNNYRPYVKVQGAVNSPVAVAYVPGMDIGYYISAAGGYSRVADERRAFVRQPNGSVESRKGRFSPGSDPEPKAGATVYVPERDPNQKSTLAESANVIGPILATLLTIIAVIWHR
jgi:polysaccharide export outer membrane protein